LISAGWLVSLFTMAGAISGMIEEDSDEDEGVQNEYDI